MEVPQIIMAINKETGKTYTWSEIVLTNLIKLIEKEGLETINK